MNSRKLNSEVNLFYMVSKIYSLNDEIKVFIMTLLE